MAIDFGPSPAQEAIRQLAREFAAKEIRPRAAELDAIADPVGSFPWDIYVRGNQLGFNKITIPSEYKGLGLGDMEAVLVIEELSVADGGIGTTYFLHNSLVYWILGAGSDEQQKKYLTECATDPQERYFISVADTEHGKVGDVSPRDHRPSAPRHWTPSSLSPGTRENISAISSRTSRTTEVPGDAQARGSPNPRLAMMLRMTSFEPAPKVGITAAR